MPDVTDKIVSLAQLAETAAEARQIGQRVVMCHGVFDVLHVGHLRYLEEARAMGDMLIVTLTPDRFVNKGPHRPAFTETLRAEMLAGLTCVDQVAINSQPTAVEAIGLIQPDLYVKGPDYKDAAADLTGKINDEADAVRSAGGEIAFTSGETYSSSRLVNSHLSVLPDDTQAWLKQFAAQHSFGDLRDWIEKASGLKVLLVGETIIDEYVYCDAIGKSSKEPTLVLKRLSSEKFAGGILAAANHVAQVCDEVGVLTLLGTENSHEGFIERRLDPKVKRLFLHRRESPTIRKTRYVEEYHFAKLLETYDINDSILSQDEDDEICGALMEQLPQYDLILTIDFGHFMLSPRAAEILRERSRFLAVNAQTNAGNLGYHTISKYRAGSGRGPDFMTATEGEARLEARDPRGDIRGIVRNLYDDIRPQQLLVTRGANGCLGYEGSGSFVGVPAVAAKVVDRVGAGDAFLSVAAPLAAAGAPLEVTSFIGNAAGALAVGTVGNREPVNRVSLLKYLESILK